MTFLIAIMSFANFVFYPLVVGAIIAVIIEQILRAMGSEDNPKDIIVVFFILSSHSPISFIFCSHSLNEELQSGGSGSR